MISGHSEDGLGGAICGLSDFLQPSPGPGKLIGAPVVGDVACNQYGVKVGAAFFTKVGQESFTDLEVAVKLRAGVGGGEVEVGEVEEG